MISWCFIISDWMKEHVCIPKIMNYEVCGGQFHTNDCAEVFIHLFHFIYYLFFFFRASSVFTTDMIFFAFISHSAVAVHEIRTYIILFSYFPDILRTNLMTSSQFAFWLNLLERCTGIAQVRVPITASHKLRLQLRGFS